MTDPQPVWIAPVSAPQAGPTALAHSQVKTAPRASTAIFRGVRTTAVRIAIAARAA